MNFKQKYPDSVAEAFVQDLVIRTDGLARCANSTNGCKNMTYFRDYAWDCSVPTCSEECQKQMWDDYFTTDAAIEAGVRSRPTTAPFLEARAAQEAVQAKAAATEAAPTPAPVAVPASEAPQSSTVPCDALLHQEIESVNLNKMYP
jgi:hypothetical protein